MAVAGTVALTGAAVWGRGEARTICVVSLGVIAGTMWLQALRSRTHIHELAAMVDELVRTVHRATALANWASVQYQAADVTEAYVRVSDQIAAAAIKALQHHDSELANDLAGQMLDAMSELEEHAPDRERATEVWQRAERELG